MERPIVMPFTKLYVSTVSFARLRYDRKKRHFRSSICHRLQKCHSPSTSVDSVRRAEDVGVLHFKAENTSIFSPTSPTDLSLIKTTVE